jgi:hypothetical protein
VGIEANLPEGEREREESLRPVEHAQLNTPGAGLTVLTGGLGNQLGVDLTADEVIAITGARS